jgi:hypothetical protein
MITVIICTHQLYSGYRIERNEMVGHVARVGKMRCAYSDSVGNLRERDHLEDPDVDGSIILR